MRDRVIKIVSGAVYSHHLPILCLYLLTKPKYSGERGAILVNRRRLRDRRPSEERLAICYEEDQRLSESFDLCRKWSILVSILE